jgi:IclR family mhp operon transcriptional activator
MRNGEAVAGMKSLLRGLLVLRSLNERGPSTVLEIAQATGISRASIYRILETLSQAGYVRRRSDAEGHELTAKVRTLSDGFSDEAWIRESAVPALDELQREIIWPADLAIL